MLFFVNVWKPQSSVLNTFCGLEQLVSSCVACRSRPLHLKATWRKFHLSVSHLTVSFCDLLHRWFCTSTIFTIPSEALLYPAEELGILTRRDAPLLFSEGKFGRNCWVGWCPCSLPEIGVSRGNYHCLSVVICSEGSWKRRSLVHGGLNCDLEPENLFPFRIELVQAEKSKSMKFRSPGHL